MATIGPALPFLALAIGAIGGGIYLLGRKEEAATTSGTTMIPPTQPTAAPPLPTPPHSAQSTCDPLDTDTWGAGNICVTSGDRFISVPEAVNPSVAPEPGFNEVTFSPDLTTYKVGGGWKLSVLDSWLNQQRVAGNLVTRYNLNLLQLFQEAPWSMLGAGLSGVAVIGMAFMAPHALGPVIVNMLLGAAGGMAGGMNIGDFTAQAVKSAIESTGAGAMASFVGSHKVRVGNQRVRINSLPIDNAATWDFAKEIADYVGRFQGSVYPGD